MSGKSKPLLSWTHYRTLLHVTDDIARKWYEEEAQNQADQFEPCNEMSKTQYYHCLLSSQNKNSVGDEIKNLTKDYQDNKLEYLKNPIIAEFLTTFCFKV